MNARGTRLREAWGHRDPENDYLGARGFDPPHLVAWPLGVGTGKALCGKPIAPSRLALPGLAGDVAVKVCTACAAAVAERPACGRRAAVVDLAARRAQRSLW